MDKVKFLINNLLLKIKTNNDFDKLEIYLVNKMNKIGLHNLLTSSKDYGLSPEHVTCIICYNILQQEELNDNNLDELIDLVSNEINKFNFQYYFM